MRNLKKFGVVLVAVLALTAFAAATAPAGTFTYTQSGNFSGANNNAQEFNVNGTSGGAINRITCNVTNTNGTINSLEYTDLTVTAAYNSCSAFLGIAATVSTPSFRFTAGVQTSNHLATVDVENAITINVGGSCTVNVPVQGNHWVDIENNPNSANTLTFNSTVNDINSTGSGGVCGSAHTSGSYAGMFTIGSAGSFRYDTNP